MMKEFACYVCNHLTGISRWAGTDDGFTICENCGSELKLPEYLRVPLKGDPDLESPQDAGQAHKPNEKEKV
jgi:hypothetical protein